MPESNEDEN